MVELICRNEPKHFFCLHNILKLFKFGTEIDVESVHNSMRTKQKCIAFQTGFCPVTESGEPCALLRRSYGSIIREQLYALEALRFIGRERGSRRLVFKITKLGRNAVRYLPILLPKEKIQEEKTETDLTKVSSQNWIRQCKKGLGSYGPFVGYLWKLKRRKKTDIVESELGSRAVNTFSHWAEECGFKRGETIQCSEEFFAKKVRIRNWIVRRYANVPPPYQEDTARFLFELKKAKVADELVKLPATWSKKQKFDILLNVENSGLLLEKQGKDRYRIRNDFDLSEYRSSIRNHKLLKGLDDMMDSDERRNLEEELASEKVELQLETEKDVKKALATFIRKRSKHNKRQVPKTTKTQRVAHERDYELYAALKRFHSFKCQAENCSFTFRKKNGEYYCEIAHVKPFSMTKDDTAGNILVLCANCHKMLDHGDETTRKIVLMNVTSSRRSMLKKLSLQQEGELT